MDLKTVTKHGKLILVVIPTPFVESVMSQVIDILSEEQVSVVLLHINLHTQRE